MLYDQYDYDAADDEEEDEEDEGDSTSDEDILRSPSHSSGPLTEMKEQMYRAKLSDLRDQLRQLKDRTLPEWGKRLRRIEAAAKERVRMAGVSRDLEMALAELDFINEKKRAAREFEDHKLYLREQLIAELEEKQKLIESERHSMELTGDNMELKTISTRKLRRRANEPTNSTGYGPGEKRRKPVQLSQLTYMLEDGDILDDLKIINKNKAFSMHHKGAGGRGGAGGEGSAGSAAQYSSAGQAAAAGNGRGSSSPSNSSSSAGGNYHRDIRVEDGKLFYEKRWFRRGQAVLVEGPKGDKFPAMINLISSDAVWVRKQSSSSESSSASNKVRIYISQLVKGKYVLKRRAA